MRKTIRLLRKIWVDNVKTEFIRAYYRNLAKHVIRNPRLFILWPISIVFILSYPALYSLYTNHRLTFNSYVSEFTSVETSHTPVLHYFPELLEGTDLQVKQIRVQKTFLANQDEIELGESSLLEKEFLLEVLDLQNQLTNGIDLSINLRIDDMRPNSLIGFLHSPLQLWNNSKEEILSDKILRRVNSLSSAKSPYGITLSQHTIFAETVKVNSLIKSTDALLISLLYIPSQDPTIYKDAGMIWDENLAKIQEESADNDDDDNDNNNNNKPNSQFLLFTKQTSKNYQKFHFKFSQMRYYDECLLVISYTGLVIYFLLSLSHIHSVKSRAGLLAAFVVEMLVSVLAAVSLTSYIFKDLDFFYIPLQVLPFVVIVVGMENMLGLVNAVSTLPEELSMGKKLSQSLSTRGLSSTLIVLIDLCILISITPFVVPSTRQFCVFAAIALSIDHFLHLTYFALILSVDIRRLELEDFLRKDDSDFGSFSRGYRRRTAPWKNIVSKLLGDSSSLLPSHGLFNDHNGHANIKLPLQQRVALKLLRVKAPITTTVSGSIFLILFLIFANLRWISRGENVDLSGKSSSIEFPAISNQDRGPISLSSHDYSISLVNSDKFVFSLDRKTSAIEISKMFNSYLGKSNKVQTDSTLTILVEEPAVLIHKSAFNEIEYKKIKAYNAGNTRRKIQFQDPKVDLISNTTHRFDLHYLLEFLTSLVFICSLTGLALKLFIKDDHRVTDFEDISEPVAGTSQGASDPKFNCKDLVNGHFLDVIRITTSANPFIISVGMDHKIFVWSPVTVPTPLPTELPLPRQLWPVTNVVMSDPGNLIAVFSKSGVIKCWSRLSMSWCWTIHIEGLRGGQFLEAFFRKRTAPPLARRRGVKSRFSTTVEQEENERSSPPLQSRKSLRRAAMKEQVSLTRTLSVDSTFDRSTDLRLLQENQNYDFIVVLRNGKVYTMSGEDGSKKEELISTVPLINANKIVSPRVNDRLVCNTETGKLVIATAINNNWKVRTLEVQEKYNSGKSLLTPKLISRSSSFNSNSQKQLQQFRSDFAKTYQPLNSSKLSQSYVTADLEFEERKKKEIALFVGTEIATLSFVGMIVRTRGLVAELIDAQTGTLLKRFNIGQFKPGTFKVFHSTPVHCRFCGSASVSSFSICYTELDTSTLILQTFSIDNRAKNNICLRVERDPRETRCLGFDSVTEHQHWLDNIEGWCVTDLNMILGVRKKEAPSSRNSSSSEIGAYSTSANSYESSSGLKSRHNNSHSKTREDEQYHIQNIWEGFSLHANGKIQYHEIPNTSNEGLLIKSIGPVAKFGHKSIVVSFGNILKVLYTGSSDLFELDIDTDNGGDVSRLGFISRRKRLNMVSYQMTHSTDFASHVDVE